MLRGLAIATGSRDGLGEYPVADDGVLFFAVVVLNRTQRSGKLDELTPLAGQQFAAGAVHCAHAGEGEIFEGTVEGLERVDGGRSSHRRIFLGCSARVVMTPG